MKPGRARATDRAGPAVWAYRGAVLCLWLLVLAAPFVYTTAIRDGFRLPKLVLCESLTLLSLLLLAALVCRSGGINWRATLRLPAFIALAPLTSVVATGLLTSPHQLHLRPALFSFVVGVAAILGWSAMFDFSTHRRLIGALAVPAVIMAAIGALQYHNLFKPIAFDASLGRRLATTSFAGNPGDLAAFLVLPALVLQVALIRGRSKKVQAILGMALALCVYGILITQTLTVVVALVGASLLVWVRMLPGRRTVAILGVAAILVAGAAITAAPLHDRILSKVEETRVGGLDGLLSGRLDGWKTALWMLGEHPLTGVGHGAYRAEFADAKINLHRQGEKFFVHQTQVFFANAHNDYLEAAAEWGLLGILAAGWAAWRLGKGLRNQVRRLDAAGKAGRADATLLMAGMLALAIMLLTSFPLRIALVAYPYLLLTSAVFADVEGAA